VGECPAVTLRGVGEVRAIIWRHETAFETWRDLIYG
jgi:hypothetical protein